MADIRKISPDDGSTILNIKDSNAVHWVDNSRTGVHNFVKTPYNGQKDNVDVTVTVDNDGVININGTQGNTDGQYFLSNRFAYDLRIKKGNYIITGGSSDLKLRVARNKTTGQSSAGGQSIGDETGSGLAINADTDIDLQIIVIIKANTTFNNVKVYPLLRLATDTDDTYVPYAMTNRELTRRVEGIYSKSISIPRNSSVRITASEDYQQFFAFAQRNIAFMFWNIVSSASLVPINGQSSSTPTISFVSNKVTDLNNSITDASIKIAIMSYADFTVS